jgi:hypothetical protein
MLATVLAGTIAFVSHHPAGIEAVAPDGSGRRTIVAGEGRYHPAWAPGGQRLAYTAGAGELRIADDSGDTVLDLGELIPSRPAWSRTGRGSRSPATAAGRSISTWRTSAAQ